MTKINQDPKKRCPAMIEAGIYDPENQDGIDFCVNYCPYEDGCIVYEYGHGISSVRRDKRVVRAKDMSAMGYSAKYIAQLLGVSKRSVERYLAK